MVFRSPRGAYSPDVRTWASSALARSAAGARISPIKMHAPPELTFLMSTKP